MNAVAEKTYLPRAGSTAERAWHFLLLARREMSASSLADEIDVTPASQIHAGLSTAVEHGFFIKTVRDGVAYYCLPGDEKDDAPLVQRVVKAEACDVPQAETPFIGPTDNSAAVAEQILASLTMPADSDDIVTATASSGPVEKQGPFTLSEPLKTCMVDIKLADASTPRPFACGLFSDGRLVLELVDGQTVTLKRDETAALCSFLDRLNEVQP